MNVVDDRNFEEIEEQLYVSLEKAVTENSGDLPYRLTSLSLRSTFSDPEVILGFKLCKGLLMVENALQDPRCAAAPRHGLSS